MKIDDREIQIVKADELKELTYDALTQKLVAAKAYEKRMQEACQAAKYDIQIIREQLKWHRDIMQLELDGLKKRCVHCGCDENGGLLQ